MNALLHWFTAPEWAPVVKTLLHSLWQGALIAAALALMMRRATNPHWRYGFALLALVLIPASGILTWAALNSPNRSTPVLVAQSVPADTAPAPTLTENPPTTLAVLINRSAAPPPSAWTAWLALLWIAGTSAMLGRASVKLAGAERLRRSCQPLDHPQVTQLLAEARRAVGLARKVRVAVTDKLTSPAVVGVLVPTLILPLTLVTTLTPEQIRFILLHELAHIRRGDYLTNLFQLFIEAVLFFNPAVWWISHQLRREREACCDALAIELSGAPADYARTLVHVAETALSPTPVAAPAFGNEREPSSLTDRVQRLLVPGYCPSLKLTWRAMVTAFVLGTVLLVLSAEGTRVAIAQINKPSLTTENEGSNDVNSGAIIESNKPPARIEDADRFTNGDLISVKFSGTTDRIPPHEERIKADGTITLPLIGSVRAAGRTVVELQKEIHDSYVPAYYKRLTVAVTAEESAAAPARLVYLGATTTTKAIQSSGDFTQASGPLNKTNSPPIEITGLTERSRIEYDVASGKTVATNGAVVRFKDTVVRADSVQVDRQSGQLVASGNVKVERPSNTNTAAQIELSIYSNQPPTQSRAIAASSNAFSSTNAPGLSTRTFKVDPNTFGKALENITATPVTGTNITGAVRSFFATLGVELTPPKGAYYNDRAGELVVRGTTEDLDVIEAALVAANKPTPQVNIKVRFVEVERGKTGTDWFLGTIGNSSVTNPPLSNLASAANSNAGPQSFTGILTEPQFRQVVKALEQRKGFSLLSEGEVTTLSGRQAQIQVVEMKTIVNAANIAVPPLSVNTTNRNASTNRYQTQVMPFGPVLDVIPTVAADGYTIQMTVIPTLTEFLGYDDSNLVFPSSAKKSKEVEILPLPRMRVRQVSTSAVVWDGQTLVLGVGNDQLITKQPGGGIKKEKNPNAHDKQLLVFITPTIVDPAGNPANSAAQAPPRR